tara:strand:+ start:75004 stop:75534 length:531 start_codon:yes stop_codon:yes gene_type:complete
MRFRHFFFIIFSAAVLSACSTLYESDDWPQTLPSKNYFTEYYQRNVDNHPYQTVEDYLAWVRIFYQGNVLSIGWEELSEGVLVELPDAKKTEYEKRMFTLGQRIGAEWALDNSVRLIDTRSASVWSDALLEAIYLKELEAFIFKMENDVDSILTGRLNKNEIAFTRYYDEEEIEFF